MLSAAGAFRLPLVGSRSPSPEVSMRTRLPAIATLLALVACNAEPSAPAGDQKPTLAVSSTGAQIITEAEITRQAENTTPTNHWVLYTRNAGAGGFVVGPSSSSSVPAEGIGSLRLSTPTAADKVVLFNYDYVGERLAISTGSRTTHGALAAARPIRCPHLTSRPTSTGQMPLGASRPWYSSRPTILTKVR
jgi:hypothetical protein